MTRFTIFLIMSCAAVFSVTALYQWIRTKRHTFFLLEITGLVAVLVVLHVLFDFSNPITLFGPSDTALIVVSFLSLVAGMAAQYFFETWGQPAAERAFDLTTFLRPLVISPLVFLPMLGLIPDIEGSSAVTERHLFVWLIAFQNGFFWRVVYEKVQKHVAS